MKYIYELAHEYYDEEQDCDIVTMIAIYSSKAYAKQALTKLKSYSKFSDYPNGFCISEYEINKQEWQDGFTSF